MAATRWSKRAGATRGSSPSGGAIFKSLVAASVDITRKESAALDSSRL